MERSGGRSAQSAKAGEAERGEVQAFSQQERVSPSILHRPPLSLLSSHSTKHYNTIQYNTMTDIKPKVVIAPNAFLSMAAHALHHSTVAVHGVLIGTFASGKVTITDAIPICHETPTTPLVDTALSLVQAKLPSNIQMVGWFTAPELLDETQPGPVALRIVSQLPQKQEPVLVVVNNSQLVRLVTDKEGASVSKTMKAFGKDFGKQWMEPLEVMVEKESSVTQAAKQVHQQGIVVNDLVDHWEASTSSEWHPTAALVTCLEKHC
jgi:hypothetical protein